MPARRHTVCLLALIVTLGLAAAGCGSQAGAPAEVTLHGLNHFPAEVQSAPARVQEAYQFAAAYPEVTRQVPCYCGCGGLGHVNLYDCYIDEVKPDGLVTIDSHALACEICVDIAQDSMRLYESGQSPGQIKAYIDTTYARYGRSNMP